MHKASFAPGNAVMLVMCDQIGRMVCTYSHCIDSIRARMRDGLAHAPGPPQRVSKGKISTAPSHVMTPGGECQLAPDAPFPG
jgi:hypothetical protein